MRKENMYTGQSEENTQAGNTGSAAASGSAFAYLKSLPPNYNNPVLESYKKSRESDIVDYQIAEDFTDSFRTTTAPFYIPVSWNMTKAALVNLLGITSHEGHAAVNGIRFYAGLNGDNQLTLVAVSTKDGTGCNDDLTEADEYPYYDYADACPSNCSNSGNLRVSGSATPLKVIVTV